MRQPIMLFFAAWLLAGSCAAEDNILKPFTTDGCSMFIDGTPSQPSLWRHCCVAHDKAYWIGGLEQQRREADTALQVCITEVKGKAMGDYMHFFVSGGGSPFWLTPYRWGYGWSYLENGQPRGYKSPTPGEQLQIDRLMPDAEKLIAEDAQKHAVTSAATSKLSPVKDAQDSDGVVTR